MRVSSSSQPGASAAPLSPEPGDSMALRAVDRSRPFAAVLRAAPSSDGPVPSGRPAAPVAPSVVATLARLADCERGVDGLLAAAARGRTFTPAQLLAMQAAVCRHAQTV